MKNLLTIAIVISTGTAFASRARTTALGNSAHIADFYSPENTLAGGELFRIETGKTAATSTTDGAEGTLIKSLGDLGKVSVSLGHLDADVTAGRGNITAPVAPAADDRLQQNPIELSYATKLADLGVGAGLIYSNYNDKNNSIKENTMGIKLGAISSAFYANGRIIFTDKYESAAADYKGKTHINLKGGMFFDSLSVHGNIVMSGYELGAVDQSSTLISVKAVESIKKDGHEFFYGAGLASSNSKDKGVADEKTTEMYLPFIIGLEAKATSWLAFRGSVTQNVLISNSKTEDSTGTTAETNPGLNTTEFSAGVGIEANKVLIDASIMKDATQQKINADDLMTQVAFTYNF